MNNKLLVLDMDGVVNSNILIKQWFETQRNQFKNYISNEENLKQILIYYFRKEFCNSTELIFSELANMITEIVNLSDCKILWSSSWRRLEKYKNLQDIKDMFNRRSLPGNAIIDTTPIRGLTEYNSSRGLLISLWLKDHLQFNKVVVLDDRNDAGDLLPHYCKFFKTDENYGITEKIKNNIIKYFQN